VSALGSLDNFLESGRFELAEKMNEQERLARLRSITIDEDAEMYDRSAFLMPTVADYEMDSFEGGVQQENVPPHWTELIADMPYLEKTPLDAQNALKLKSKRTSLERMPLQEIALNRQEAVSAAAAEATIQNDFQVGGIGEYTTMIDQVNVAEQLGLYETGIVQMDQTAGPQEPPPQEVQQTELPANIQQQEALDVEGVEPQLIVVRHRRDAHRRARHQTARLIYDQETKLSDADLRKRVRARNMNEMSTQEQIDENETRYTLFKENRACLESTRLDFLKVNLLSFPVGRLARNMDQLANRLGRVSIDAHVKLLERQKNMRTLPQQSDRTYYLTAARDLMLEEGNSPRPNIREEPETIESPRRARRDTTRVSSMDGPAPEFAQFVMNQDRSSLEEARRRLDTESSIPGRPSRGGSVSQSRVSRASDLPRATSAKLIDKQRISIEQQQSHLGAISGIDQGPPMDTFNLEPMRLDFQDEQQSINHLEASTTLVQDLNDRTIQGQQANECVEYIEERLNEALRYKEKLILQDMINHARLSDKYQNKLKPRHLFAAKMFMQMLSKFQYYLKKKIFVCCL
jgi:hypothetical protein